MKLYKAPIVIRPEEDLLLCCSRMCMDSERAERIRVLLGKDMDWSYLIQMALKHGLIPLLHRSLKSTCPDSVPEGVSDQLRKYFLVNASRNLILTEELLKLLDLFDAHGILVVPYKGLALAASIYGDLTLRQFGDLDILIHKEDVPRAKELLISQGYHPNLDFNSLVEEELYFRSSFKRSLHFECDRRKILVDLHWGIESRYLSFALNLDLLDHLEQIFLNGHAIKTINTEYLIYLLCIHGAQHAWTQINWICDIAELIKGCGDMEWGWIIDHAHALGIRRMVSCGFLLAAWLLEVELQEEVLQRIRIDPLVQSTADQVIRKLFQEKRDRPGRFERQIFYLRAMEQLGDRARYCFNLVMNPSHAEWSTLALSTHLYPVYHFLRPLRLIGKYGLELLTHIHNGDNSNKFRGH